MGKPVAQMEDQVPPSQSPIPTQITPDQLAEMKARAREMAIQQTLAQQVAIPQQRPQVVYLRRNLTVAEFLLVILLSCGLVTGIQAGWHFASNILPRLEIKVR
jgi:hypothetical protein